ncbi:MAG TPA: FAD-binding protein, partial [Rhodanobacter sp.]|nr:FAD-binding protein [Rhodanobacter sp.]
ATLARFCEHSAANLAWLEACGVRFGARTSPHKTSYPPDGVFLYYSGSEMVPAFRGATAPTPRGHRVVSNGQSGAALYAAMQQATLRAGARPLRQAAVRRLVRLRGADGQPGRVVGVEAWCLPEGDPRTRRHAELDARIARWRLYHPGKAAAARREQAAIEQALAAPCYLRAGRAVVLATGGYIYNPELIATHAPRYRAGWPIGGAGCDGSGVRLGSSIGAATARLGNISAWRFITPPYGWPKGLVVNARGERFCNEQVYGARLGYEIVEHQDGKAWLILDARLRRQAIRECLFGRLWAFQSIPALMLMLAGSPHARSLADLARRIGADPATLEATVAAANAAADGSHDDPFGKSPDMRQACLQPPFHALDISMGARRFPLATLSLGGLVVDEADGHVRDAQGANLPGLFAAGRAAIGLASAHYVSGLSLADCVFSGRRAGRAAAAEATAGVAHE